MVKGKPFNLKESVGYADGSIVSKTLIKKRLLIFARQILHKSVVYFAIVIILVSELQELGNKYGYL